MMKQHKKTKNADPLTSLFTQEQLDMPTAEFSDRLLHVSMTSYKMSYSTKYRKEERLGKFIIVMLIFFNLMMLYMLNPFGMHNAVLLSLLAFLVGVAILLWMSINNSLFQAMRYPMHSNGDKH